MNKLDFKNVNCYELAKIARIAKRLQLLLNCDSFSIYVKGVLETEDELITYENDDWWKVINMPFTLGRTAYLMLCQNYKTIRARPTSTWNKRHFSHVTVLFDERISSNEPIPTPE